MIKNKHLIIEQLELTDKQFLQLEERYALIEPIVADYTTPEEKQKLRLEAQVKLRIKERTLRQLIHDFKKKGIVGLVRKKRKDFGQTQIINEDILEKAKFLLKENPYRSVRMIVELLKEDPEFSEKTKVLKKGTLYHHLRKSGYNFKHKQGFGSQKVYRKFEAPHANSLWQGDARHGIEVEHPTKANKKKRCYLFAWVDDYSRKIIFAHYYFDEKVFSLEDSFRQAILRMGIPEKIYLDNGSAYISKQFAIASDSIGTRKIHHPPYQAYCKGKVERDMQKFKRFQEEAICAGVQTIDELNTLLHAWIEIEHNQKIHTSTGETPDERFKKSIEKFQPRRIDDLEKFNSYFLWRDKRVISKYGSISLNKNNYKIKEIGIGEQVEIRYDPMDLKKVHIYYKEKFHSTVVAYKLTREEVNNAPEEKKDSVQKISVAAKRHFENIITKHQEQKIKESNLSFSNIISKES